MSLRKSVRPIIITMFSAALLITSCNVGGTAAPTTDINALSTAIVQTTVAQIAAQTTQTAQAAPTNTLPPVASPTQSLPTDAGVASPTIDVSLIPTFSFDSTSAATSVTVLNTPGSSLPTAVSLPSSTPAGGTGALGDACNNLQYLYDVTIPDGSSVKGGESFTKLWAVKNTGSCTWDDGYTLIRIGGDTAVGTTNFQFKKSEDFVAGGTEKIIGVPVNAPCAAGNYQAHFRMQNDRGYYFGTILSMYFTVTTEKVGGCK